MEPYCLLVVAFLLSLVRPFSPSLSLRIRLSPCLRRPVSEEWEASPASPGQLALFQGGHGAGGTATPGGNDDDEGMDSFEVSDDDDPDGTGSSEVEITEELHRSDSTMFVNLATYKELYGDFNKARHPDHKKITIRGIQGILVPVDDEDELMI